MSATSSPFWERRWLSGAVNVPLLLDDCFHILVPLRSGMCRDGALLSPSVFDVPLLPVIAAVASLIPSYLSYRWVTRCDIDPRLIAVSTGVPILVSMSDWF